MAKAYYSENYPLVEFRVEAPIKDMLLLQAVVKNAPQILQRVARKITFKFAKKLQKDLQSAIRSQRLKHKPLTPRYKAYKKTHNLDPRILIATKAYVNSICVMRLKGGAKSKGKGMFGPQIDKEEAKDFVKGSICYIVGVPNKKHPSSKKLTFAMLARIHEFGTLDGNIPPRPHWRPLWREFNRKDRKLMVKEIVTDSRAAIRKELGRLGKKK